MSIRNNWLAVRAGLWTLLLILSVLSPCEAEHLRNGAAQLSLITPGDPSFDLVIDENYPGLTTSSIYPALRPSIAVLKNDGLVAIKAYAVEWQTTRVDGTHYTIFTAYLSRLESLHISPPPLRPGDIRLISHWFSLSPTQFVNVNVFMQTYATAITSELLPRASTPTLDGAAFSNGEFDGPNSSGILQAYRYARNADHDAAVDLLEKISSFKSQSEIEDIFTREIARGGAVSQKRTAARYATARLESVTALHAIYSKGGLPALDRALFALANYSPAGQFTRMAELY